ncbi:bifunctional phosphopantothenoylcysteine decarboxylase/phosphopantothenate--cysteine ligase CoaBC [Corynebacterium uberis]|uniref:bifunctional phosphopantothenoylcysteine decarboxylase/phosphopantothenate--cysteine ligase CoaBC n=1 Tax=Corynebacterium uberis TaxID=2883169 RepID=UPI0037DC360E
MSVAQSGADAGRRRVVVGVGGGIAAYKVCHVVRAVREHGDDVQVVPTDNALRFVGAATWEALSGHPVDTGVFEKVDEVNHVRIGQEADLVIVAPATADLLARMAAGRADDLLTASLLMASCPVVVAPAMHTEMWTHPATQANVATLRERGVVVLEPAAGRLTGADSGAGRLLEPEQIVALARAADAGVSFARSLEGVRVVVTAGGTREAMDPVRFIGNRSSGRQGFALAELAAQRGAEVTVIAAATEQLPVPAGASVVRVNSALELQEATQAAAGEADVVIMAAAVADMRPAAVAAAKLKKTSQADAEALGRIDLVENPDILAGLVRSRDQGDLGLGAKEQPVIVGFAAETGDAESSALEHGRSKFLRKGCDLMMCNEVGTDKVFGSSQNAGWLLGYRGASRSAESVTVQEVAQGSKLEVAGVILDAVGELLH